MHTSRAVAELDALAVFDDPRRVLVIGKSS